MEKLFALTWFLMCVQHVWCRTSIQFIGIFPIHTKVNNSHKCGRLQIERGIQRLEAMEYAINKININQTILRNLIIQPIYIDSRDQSSRAVEKVLEKILHTSHGTKSCKKYNNNMYEMSNSVLAGVIGGSSSSVSVEIANLLRLFKIPQISYASTSNILNDPRKYDFFTRTVPPDTRQAEAMIDILKELNLKSFSVLYSEGSYGEDGFDALKRKSDCNENLCLVYQKKLNIGSNFAEIAEELRQESNSKLVILFCQTAHIRLFLNSLKESDDFTILASDFWGNKKYFLNTQHLKNIANGTISLKLTSPRVSDFIEYFNTLNKSENNKWFDEYLKERKKVYEVYDDKLAYVMDAVYALAHAVNQVYVKNCPEQNGVCIEMEKKIELGTEVMNTLRNLTYPGVFGHTMLNENGSSSGGYQFLRYINGNYIDIAKWNGSVIFTKQFDELNSITSFCSIKCTNGQGIKQKANKPNCCYDCVECGSNQFTDSAGKCRHCLTNQRPNRTRNGCERIPERFIQQKLVAAVVAFSSVGIILTVFVSLIFVYNKDTQIVKLSAPELTFPLLVGLLLCYSMPFVLVADQNEALCGARRFGIGFSFTVCYSSILIKTNRLARVFNSKTVTTPRFLSATSQLVIMSAIVFIQAAFAAIGLIYNQPVLLHENPDGRANLMVCDVPNYEAIVNFVYNFLLVSICTLYAFRTRKIPSCFNEAKHLGFVMYISLLLLASFLPIYMVDISADIYVVVLSVNMVLCATSILVVLFGPKLYIILIHPSRNQRSISMRSFTNHSQSVDNETKKVNYN